MHMRLHPDYSSRTIRWWGTFRRRLRPWPGHHYNWRGEGSGMEYKLHRVAPNSDGWVRPSPGRLSSDGVGDYVKENSFGHQGCSTLSTEFPLEERIGSGESGGVSILT